MLTVSTNGSKEEWVMDSGCSFHITPNKDVLFDLEEFEGGRVLMANNTHCDVKVIGEDRSERHRRRNLGGRFARLFQMQKPISMGTCWQGTE